jgi:hypothetical protein
MKTIRKFNPMTDRYAYDFGKCSLKNGFAQVDTSQDASYFGTWANPETLTVITYCEGDTTIRIAETTEKFVKEIQTIKKWNEDNGHKFLGIDPGLNYELTGKFRVMGLGSLLH